MPGPSPGRGRSLGIVMFRIISMNLLYFKMQVSPELEKEKVFRDKVLHRVSGVTVMLEDVSICQAV